MSRLLPLMVLLVWPGNATAMDELLDTVPQPHHVQAPSMPVIYAMDKIIIERNNVTDATGPDGGPVALPRQLKMPVEVRDAQSFYKQDGWFNLTNIKDGQGLLLLFDNSEQAPISQTSQYAPVDILMINARGNITSIIPSLVLAQLEQTYYPEEPVKAFLMLSGGTCERLFIRPGDDVVHSAFKKPVPVLDTNNPVAPSSLTPGDDSRLETPVQELPQDAVKSGDSTAPEEEPFSLEKFRDFFNAEPQEPIRRRPAAQPEAELQAP
ncbi:MAG: DUF192 domain-containing protein [Alphaproteobacteria bacterium]